MEPARTFEALLPDLEALVGAYRDRCLWFLVPDFMPANVEQALRALNYIERYGDRQAFVRARELRECLLRISNATSVD
jgi:hypothetical protein